MPFAPTQAFVAINDDGVKEHFGPGQVLPDGHWCVKRSPHLFEAVEVKAARRDPVEQATAAPGEKRSVRRTRKAKED